jgi:hypothetical protein
MEMIKSVLMSLVISQLAFGPVLASAAQAKRDQKAAQARFVRSTFNFIVRQSAMVTNAKEFNRSLLFMLKPADRKAIMGKLAKEKNFPTFRRVNETLVMDNGLKKYTLTWPDATKHEYEINGVKWSYNPAKPFLPQYETLEKALAAKKSAFIFDQLIPRAEALFWVPVLMMLVGAVVGVVASDLAAEGWCWGVEHWDAVTQKCIDLQRSKESALFQDAPQLDAVSNQAGSDNSNVLAKFEAQDFQCPTNNDGKEREYRGRIRTVETKDGQTSPTSNWFNVSGKFSPEGYPTDIIITRDDTNPGSVDTTSVEGSEKLVIHITFDPTTKKPISYRVPNPDYNPAEDLLGKPTLTLMQNQKLSKTLFAISTTGITTA